MSVPISDWHPELRGMLMGVDSLVLTQSIKAVARELYTDSGMWVETISDIGTTAGLGDLDLSALAVFDGHDAYVISVFYVKYDETYLKIQHDLNTNFTGDVPIEVYPLSSESIRLIPTPAATVPGIIDVRVTLVPAFATDVLPNEAKNVWFDVIVDGVLGRLYGQPGKTFTNQVKSQYHLRRFQQGKSKARDAGRRRYSNTESSWTFPGWA